MIAIRDCMFVFNIEHDETKYDFTINSFQAKQSYHRDAKHILIISVHNRFFPVHSLPVICQTTNDYTEIVTKQALHIPIVRTLSFSPSGKTTSPVECCTRCRPANAAKRNFSGT